MSTDAILHIAEILVVGAPLWYGAARLSLILREFPPHIHEYNREGSPTIRYPRGYEPGQVQNINGGNR